MDMSTSDMDMSTMSTSNTTMTTTMDMSMMSMTFFISKTTALYSNMWTPTTDAGYAGTCIFLILLATLFRGLLAVKAWKESAWLAEETNRRYVSVAGKGTKSERISMESDVKNMTLSENGVEENVMVVKTRTMGVRPWRLSVDPVRAVMDTIIAGVGWLLMLAIMTMNLGYFLSVLGGTFLGSLALGRYVIAFEH
ncbi:hypothetical protein EYC80_006745 [Monilinia laxa]|uniref:Copper transport protein n=1 Tax=Monilinia laxa TaxID=61186 RepID=A0A5N6JZ37_MONLA|nr:hypothetical protein EYC80_006745 [Monilinia laxa]